MTGVGEPDGGWWRPWSLRELTGAITSGATRSADALERCYRRTAESEAALRAWVQPPGSLSFGERVPTAGLGGVPLGVKDIIDVAGVATGCGSRTRDNAPAAVADAAIVAEWRRAGAVPVGKTVTTEFAYFSPGPTQNPAVLGHTPGGSSSGSAAAVASGQVPLALGSQTAGSTTRPAAYCGVAALVMTPRRFSTRGVVGLSPSLDSHGVFAAQVHDLAFAWSALTGAPDAALGDRRAPRVLMWTAAPLNVVGAEMRGALDITRARLEAAGATVENFPDEDAIAEVASAHAAVMAYEAARERAAEREVESQLSTQLADLLDTGANTEESTYTRALEVTRSTSRWVVALLESYDAIVGPAAPGPAPRGLDATGDPILSRPWQAMGMPAVTIPGLRSASGMPLGLQAVGVPSSETSLLAAATWVEAELGET